MNSDNEQADAISNLRSGVFYGDENTYERRSFFELKFKQRGLTSSAWFHEVRQVLSRPLAGRPELMAALLAAKRLGAPLVVPCDEDLRSFSEAAKLADAARELGVEVIVGSLRLDDPGTGRDELDLAVRRFLAERRDVVIEVQALDCPVSSVEDALRVAAGAVEAPASPKAPIDGPYMARLLGTTGYAQSGGWFLPIPPLPDLSASRREQECQAARIARWLGHWQYWKQAQIAGLFREIGFHSRLGRPFTQPMVSLLLRDAA